VAARATAVVVLGVLAVAGWGVAGGLGAALLVLREEPDPPAVVAASPSVGFPEAAPAEPAPPAGPAPDSYTLTVHTDGCGVIRSEGPGGEDLHGLTWSVLDADGFVVLGRNALGETRYRYFSPGTFDVVLEAYGGESYVPVSNTVTITC
jgi:hypothetical protein